MNFDLYTAVTTLNAFPDLDFDFDSVLFDLCTNALQQVGKSYFGRKNVNESSKRTATRFTMQFEENEDKQTNHDQPKLSRLASGLWGSPATEPTGRNLLSLLLSPIVEGIPKSSSFVAEQVCFRTLQEVVLFICSEVAPP